jgi:hypothetical protein
MYTCDKCKGISTSSKCCENPACPLMPCCMQIEEMCTCNLESAFYSPMDAKKLATLFELANINEQMSFFYGTDEITILHPNALLGLN